MIADLISSTAGVLIAGWLLIRLPLAGTAQAIIHTSRRAVSVLGSQRISEHWKERAVPAYSLKLFQKSILLGCYLLIAIATFAVAFSLTQLFFGESVGGGILRLLRWETQLVALTVSLLLGIACWRLVP